MVSHKSLIAWQEAERVSSGVIELSRLYWRPFVQALFSQLQRASLSAQINLAEGYAYMGGRTYRRHLEISYGSSVETGELLELLAKSGVVPETAMQDILTHCCRSQRLILGLLKRVRSSQAGPST